MAYSLRKRPSNDDVADENEMDLRKVESEMFGERWSTEDILKLQEGILTHGHLSPKVLEELPNKSFDSYMKIFRMAHDYAKDGNNSSLPEHASSLNNWIGKVESRIGKIDKGPLDISFVLKLLSMDGVIENHPLPEEAMGIDFGACYRLLYQAMLGYPLQPVNEATFKLFSETLVDVAKSAESNRDLVAKMDHFSQESKKATIELIDAPKKDIKSYSGKKQPKASDETDESMLSELLEDPSFNPLNFPISFMQKIVAQGSTHPT